MQKLSHYIRDSSLTIILFVLFGICFLAQSFCGWYLNNDTLAAHGRPLIGYWRNLSSSIFLEGLASNWQAAFLQLASLIVLSEFFYQRGAPHSRNPNKKKRRKTLHRSTWAYRNSLFLAFLLFFVVSLALHIVFGDIAYNEELAFTNQPPISVARFLLSAKFWSSTLQTWQAEYLAIAFFIVLGVFLRQQDSAESKPVEARDATTGEVNT